MSVGRIMQEIRRNYKDRLWWKRHLVLRLSRLLYRKKTGVFIMKEQWNHLIILDACRFDVFKEEIQRTSLVNEGKLEYRISRGSMTREFLLENFGEGYFEDIVYITANPFVDMLLKGRFYKIIPVWKDGWDEQLNTVHPRTVYEYVLKSVSKYPDKKFIIHFMQPHFPYLTIKLYEETGFAKHREAVLEGKTQWKDITIWDLVERGKVDIEEVKLGYRESLRITLKYVERLVGLLDGRIVITSDHGEAFGEYLHKLIPIRVYGHPQGVRIEPLIKVPWFVIEKPVKRDRQYDAEKMKLSLAVRKFIQENRRKFYNSNKN